MLQHFYVDGIRQRGTPKKDMVGCVAEDMKRFGLSWEDALD